MTSVKKNSRPEVWPVQDFLSPRVVGAHEYVRDIAPMGSTNDGNWRLLAERPRAALGPKATVQHPARMRHKQSFPHGTDRCWLFWSDENDWSAVCSINEQFAVFCSPLSCC